MNNVKGQRSYYFKREHALPLYPTDPSLFFLCCFSYKLTKWASKQSFICINQHQFSTTHQKWIEKEQIHNIHTHTQRTLWRLWLSLFFFYNGYYVNLTLNEWAAVNSKKRRLLLLWKTDFFLFFSSLTCLIALLNNSPSTKNYNLGIFRWASFFRIATLKVGREGNACEAQTASDQSNLVYCGKQTTKTISLNLETSIIGPLKMVCF